MVPLQPQIECCTKPESMSGKRRLVRHVVSVVSSDLGSSSSAQVAYPVCQKHVRPHTEPILQRHAAQVHASA